jgi:hypothetical protein
MPTPNRAQRDAATYAQLYLALGRDTAAAAGLAALVRAARTPRDRHVLMATARALRLTDHPAFRVNP